MKRTKLECLECGSVFDNEDLIPHKKMKHDGQEVKTKHYETPSSTSSEVTSSQLPEKEDKSAGDASSTKNSTENDDSNVKESTVASIDDPTNTTATEMTDTTAADMTDSTAADMTDSTATDIIDTTTSAMTDATETENESKLEESDVKNDDSSKTQTNMNVVEDTKSPLIEENRENSPMKVNNPEEKALDDNSSQMQVETAAKSISWSSCDVELRELLDVMDSCMELMQHRVESLDEVSFFSDAAVKIQSMQLKSTSFIQTVQRALSKVAKNVTVTDDQTFLHDPANRPETLNYKQKLILISMGPHQPVLSTYPENEDVKKGVKQFCPDWYKTCPHLEYSIVKDAAFCFVCYLFYASPGKNDKKVATWVSTGYRNWDRLAKLSDKGKMVEHFSSQRHKYALYDYYDFINEDSHDVDSSYVSQNETVNEA